MGKNQIGYSLIFVETLKPYNEKTKRFEPLKIKRVEVCQELSEYFSNDEKAKNMMFDKMFDYKEDVKRLLDNNEYDYIPSYHKESLKKDQKISDLKAKLAESENENKKIMDLYWNEIAGYEAEVKELKQQLAEKDEFLERIMSGEYIPANIAEKSLKLSNQTAIAELEKVRTFITVNNEPTRKMTAITRFINQQIKPLKGDK